MRIAVDLTSLDDNFSGLERSAVSLTEAWIKENREDVFIIVVKNRIPKKCLKWKKIHKDLRFLRVKGKNRLLVNQFLLPWAMLAARADACVFPAFPIPLLYRKRNAYGMIPDVTCLEYPESMKKKAEIFFRVMDAHTACVSDRILTVSEFSKMRIAHFYPKMSEEGKKVVVLPNGVDQRVFKRIFTEEQKEGVRLRYGLPKRYWLTLATIEPRKNIGLLLEAYAALLGEDVPKLVLAGRNGWKNKEIYEERKNVLFTGFIEEKDLPCVYAMADAFIFPSAYEGFGLPPLEALACGVRKVLLSDIEVHKEIYGNGLRYFKSGDKDSLTEALRGLMEETWEESGFDVGKYSWEKSAKKLDDMIRQRVSSPDFGLQKSVF